MRVYLAGPDVFREDALSHFNSLKIIAIKYNIQAVSPLDNVANPFTALTIFKANIRLIDECDAIVANLVPFRGLGVDDGTAFEIGYGFAKGKIISGYSPVNNIPYKDQAKKKLDLLDQEFQLLEDFGQPCNLMITESIMLQQGRIYKTFEDCILNLVKNK